MKGFCVPFEMLVESADVNNGRIVIRLPQDIIQEILKAKNNETVTRYYLIDAGHKDSCEILIDKLTKLAESAQ